jgi:hypothetical protein
MAKAISMFAHVQTGSWKKLGPASVMPPSSVKAKSVNNTKSGLQDAKAQRAGARRKDWAAYISSRSNRVGTSPPLFPFLFLFLFLS